MFKKILDFFKKKKNNTETYRYEDLEHLITPKLKEGIFVGGKYSYNENPEKSVHVVEVSSIDLTVKYFDFVTSEYYVISIQDFIKKFHEAKYDCCISKL